MGDAPERRGVLIAEPEDDNNPYETTDKQKKVEFQFIRNDPHFLSFNRIYERHAKNKEAKQQPQRADDDVSVVQEDDDLDPDTVGFNESVWGAYDDDTIFDNLSSLLPDVDSRFARYSVIISITLQVWMLALLFSAHHYKRSDFDCCNMFAVTASSVFVIVQFPYYLDWQNVKKNKLPQWHRGNIFVPFYVFMGVFAAWFVGMLSMFAHTVNVQFFDWVNFGALDTQQKISFCFCTVCMMMAFVVSFVLDYSHRNSLGPHYYYLQETSFAMIFASDHPTPNEGSFGLEYVTQRLAQLLGVRASFSAKFFMPKLIIVLIFLEIVFFVFAIFSYAYKQSTKIAPMLIVSVGLLLLFHYWRYFVGALSSKVNITRKWNRAYLWFPTKAFLVVFVVYLVAMANLYFTTTGTDIWNHFRFLDTNERVIFALGLLLLVLLLALQTTIALIHLKGWAEEREVGLGVRDPYMVRAEESILGMSLLSAQAVTDQQAQAEAPHIDEMLELVQREKEKPLPPKKTVAVQLPPQQAEEPHPEAHEADKPSDRSHHSSHDERSTSHHIDDAHTKPHYDAHRRAHELRQLRAPERSLGMAQDEHSVVQESTTDGGAKISREPVRAKSFKSSYDLQMSHIDVPSMSTVPREDPHVDEDLGGSVYEDSGSDAGEWHGGDRDDGEKPQRHRSGLKKYDDDLFLEVKDANE